MTMPTALQATPEGTTTAAEMKKHAAQGDTSRTDTDCSSEDESVAEVRSPTVAPTVESQRKSLREMIEPRAWSLLTLSGLMACAPFVISCTLGVVAFYRTFLKRAEPVPPNGKVAIVSGGKMTKAFVIAKQLKAQGCRVVLVETSKYWMVASRFSSAVDRFVTVPIPEKETEAYLQAMVRLAEEEKADLFVPVTSPVASQYEARLNSLLPARCRSWSLDAKETEMLDDKVHFCNSAESLGLSVPQSHRVCSHAEVRAFNDRLRQQVEREPTAKAPRFILKNLQYDSMHRLDLFTVPCAPATLDAYLADITIDEANPWTLQTFIVGQEYSTCAIVCDGRLLAFTDNEASISCFNYEPARNAKLRAWVETFCAARKLSGIGCFDFIVESDGTPYAIECNPRASSNLANFYNHSGLGAILVSPEAHSTTVEPLPGVVETYWLFSEVWAAIAKPGRTPRAMAGRFLSLLHTLAYKKDAYFDAEDPLPFLAHLFIHLPMLLLRNLRSGNKWAKIDPCIGKLTEENGD